jgi:hypothetical protein
MRAHAKLCVNQFPLVCEKVKYGVGEAQDGERHSTLVTARTVIEAISNCAGRPFNVNLVSIPEVRDTCSCPLRGRYETV